MRNSLLTPAARRHILRMVRAVAPAAARLERQFRALLGDLRYDRAQIRALMAITPAASSRLRTAGQFLEQVEYNGRRLAKLNLPPAEVHGLLSRFDGLLCPQLESRFGPAREQLRLLTMLALQEGFYEVRDAEAQAFFGLYRAESGAVDLDDLLRRSVEVIAMTFRARAGRFLMLERPSAGRLARPLYIESGQAGEKLIADSAMRGRYASYWSYPVQPAGLIQLGFRVRYPWLPREMVLLAALAARCQEAIERARMEHEILRLGAAARQTEEEERRRIGRELHDETAQSLLTVRLNLELIERDAPLALRPRLRETRALAERAVAELRSIIAALSPSVLERLGLERALRQLAARFRKTHPTGVRVSVGGNCRNLPSRLEGVIYRVAQECLQNAAKHSHASRVNLSLRAVDRCIRLRVSDNGAGFYAETACKQPMTFGLAGMRERAALVGGKLTVQSTPGKGTAVILQLPEPSAPVANDDKNSRPVD